VVVLWLPKPQLSPYVVGRDVVVVLHVLHYSRCPRDLVAFPATALEFSWQHEVPLLLVFPKITMLLLRMYPFAIGDIVSDDVTMTTKQVN